MVLWLLALPLLRIVTAAPGIVFPINSQVPPVARVSKAFQFTFASSTFAADAGSINYTLANAPRWLQLDTPSRSLFGTPGPQDAGAPTFNLVASDVTGSNPMAVTLVVSAEPGPALGGPVADQLSAFGSFSSPQSLIVAYARPINFNFSHDTFTNTNGNTVYYALCANNTPLPSWINFDPDNLAFSGIAPPSTLSGELSQTYDIHLTASDVVGFSGAIVSFQLVVETHIFEFGPEPKQVDPTPGVFVNYSGLQNSLTLDGKPFNVTDLDQVVSDGPSWLSLDKETLTLSGSPPNDVSSTNFTVSAIDKYGDQAAIIVRIQTSNTTACSLFPNTLGPVNATIDSVFAYSLGGALDSDPGLQVSVDLADTPWLSFDPASRSLEGTVPSNVKPGQVMLDITATQGGKTQNATLTINILPPTLSDSAPGSSGPASASGGKEPASPYSTSRTPHSAAGLSVGGSHANKWLAAAVVLPLLAALSIFILFCCLRKRRRNSRRGYMKPSKEQVSRPRPLSGLNRTSFLPPRRMSSTPTPPVSNMQTENARSRIPAFQHHSIDSILQGNTSSKAPQVDLKRQSRTLFSAVGLPQEPYAALFAAAAKPTYELAAEDQQRLSQSSKGTSKKARLSRVPDIAGTSHGLRPRQSLAQKKRHSAVSNGSSAGPFMSRISGFGHGRNGLSGNTLGRGRSVGVGHGNGGLLGHKTARDSCLSTEPGSWVTLPDSSSSNNPGSEHSHGLASNLRSFPRPPTSSTIDRLFQSQNIKKASEDDTRRHPTIRRVLSGASDLWPARQEFLEKRARNRHRDNTFFAANPSSRASSQLVSLSYGENTFPFSSSRPSSKTHPSPNNEPTKENTKPTTQPHPSSSSSSSLDPASKPSPTKRTPRHRRRPFFHSTIRTISHSRSRSRSRSNFRSANASMHSSRSSGPELDLREEIDADGRKRWRHVDNPNPLGSNRILADEGRDPSPSTPGALDVETLLGTEAGGSRAMRLSKLNDGRWVGGGGGEGWRAGGGDEIQRRAILGSHRAKRPVSVPNDIALRPGGPSFRGDIEGAFL